MDVFKSIKTSLNDCFIRGLKVFFAVTCFFTALSVSGEELSDKEQEVLEGVTGSFSIRGCCDTTIAGCLSLKRDCPAADRLYGFAEWLVKKGLEPSEIKEQLRIRYNGFTAEKTYQINTSGFDPAGDQDAPVEIVVYVSAYCNICKSIVGAVYDSITSGSLNGKAKLIAKPFGKGVGNKALAASYSERKFWDLFLQMSEVEKRLNKRDILNMAESIGISKRYFETLIESRDIKALLDSSSAEARRNRVEVTPTFFINGKRYRSYKDPEWVVDAALFEYNRLEE